MTGDTPKHKPLRPRRRSRDLRCHDCQVEVTARNAGYMVYDSVWAAAGMPTTRNPPSGFLCVACLERRLGRELTIDDLTLALINDPRPKEGGRLAQIRRESRQYPGSQYPDWRDIDDVGRLEN
jgi:hypothetical protein